MNHISVFAEEVPLPSWSGRAQKFIDKALRALGHKNWNVSLLVCDDNFIRRLNLRYRQKDEATDVLSFGFDERTGDIALSLDSLKSNAAYFCVAEDDELKRLLIHALLHLEGKDHSTNNLEEPMLVFQEELLLKLKKESIL
ncbi:MAG: rRNA maturation RNase YbeY [Spirochaetaceae bacterium]|jgi:probable rRNA maturation factor|nr:rRNA maturation RNase YbeY [Spirochaetaceae bacterium]GMO27739.1 MAG: hypothetical protein Pg6A_15420 [Termitinemataceae bacterium]